jgi:tetratricopeptide (TPR) repeat protein
LITRRGQCFFYENGKVVDIPASLSISKEDTEGDKDLVQKQSFNKAVAQMKKELEIDPTNLGTIFRLMYYYLNSPESVGGGKEKAIEEAEAIKKQNTAAGHCALAMIFAHEKNYKQAENEYLKAIEINPTNVKPMYYLGYLYQENKQYEKAVSTFEKILMIDSTEINAYYQIGRTSCFSHKNLDRAEECFKKYIEKYIETNPEKGSPSIDMAHWRLGIIYKLQGKKDFAVKEFKKALALNPNNKWAKNALKEVQDE